MVRYLFVILLVFVFTPLLSLILIIKPTTIQSNIFPDKDKYYYQETWFETEDKLLLHGWFIPATENKNPKTIVFLHGYPAEKGDILPFAKNFKKNYNLFLFDFRSLGGSEGTISTIGLNETKDVVAALDYLENEHKVNEVYVWGFSMGAATALLSAHKDSRIKKVVSDSSFANLSSMATETFRFPIINQILGQILNIWAFIILGTHPSNVSPASIIDDLDIPVMIIHSKDDNMIPFSEALIIKNSAAGNHMIEFWFREHAPHGNMNLEYVEKIKEFIK